jgi:hypothetical protein
MSELTMRPTRLETSPVYAHLDDWEVLEDGEPIGRIYESREKRPGLEWYWSITSMRYWDARQFVTTHAYATSLDEAKKAFWENWEGLKRRRPDSTPLP